MNKNFVHAFNTLSKKAMKTNFTIPEGSSGSNRSISVCEIKNKL